MYMYILDNLASTRGFSTYRICAKAYFNPYKHNVFWGGGDIGNSADPDQTECFIKNLNKTEKYHPPTLKTEMDWFN